MSEPGGFQVHQDTEAGVLADSNVPMRVVTVTQDSLRLVTRLEDGTPVYWESGERTAPGEVVTQPLTGFAAGSNTAIVPTDSVIGALQKAQGQLNAKLNEANPMYTGRLTGPTQYVESDEQILVAVRRPATGAQGGRIHGVAFQAQTLNGTWVEFGRLMTYIGNNTDAAWTGGMRLMAYKDGAILQALETGPDGVRVGSGLPLQMGTTTVVDASRNISGATVKGANAAGTGTRPLVALADGTFDDQDAATFRGTIGALAASLKGTANGVAELGADGRVPSGQLPSYVDDVLEYANFAAFPVTGESSKIYITQNDNKTWRWSGTAYAEISASLALGETPSTAHRGDHGAIAYNHSQATGNPHGATAAQVGAAEADHEHSTDDVTSGILPTSRGGTGNNDIPSGFLISTNQYVQSMGLTDNTVPFYGGATQGFWNLQFSPEFSISSGSDPVLSLAGIAWSKVVKTGAVAADIGAAKAPSKVDISASTTIGSIDATAIKVTATDVNLTLSGGVNGQGWDVINPTTATGIAIPSGATLWKSNGFDVGPTTISLGGGRPIRITRIDANTWTMLGSQ